MLTAALGNSEWPRRATDTRPGSSIQSLLPKKTSANALDAVVGRDENEAAGPPWVRDGFWPDGPRLAAGVLAHVWSTRVRLTDAGLP